MEAERKNVKESEQTEREIRFLTNPMAQFVSLVSRGANQIPFRVVKIQTPDGGHTTMVKKVIQAIIAPKELSEEKLKEMYGEDIEVSQKMDFGKYVRYDQFKRELCNPDSFELVLLDQQSGVKGLAAELKEQSDNLVVKLFRRKEEIKAMEMPESSVPVEREEAQKMMSEGIVEEYYALGSLIQGILAQTYGTVEEKIAQLRKAFDNFIAYVSEAFAVSKLDCIPDLQLGQTADAQIVVEKVGKKLSRLTIQKLKSVIDSLQQLLVESADDEEDVTKTDTNQEETMKPEEIQELIAKAVEPSIADLTALKAQVETMAKTIEPLADVMKSISSLKEEVEKLAKSPATTVKVDSGDVPQVKKDAGKQESVFKNVFFRVDADDEE